MFNEVKETCIEYGEHQSVYSLHKTVSRNSSGVRDVGTHNKQQGIDELALDNMDMLYKSFEYLAFLITRSKPKPCIQDVICHKCKKIGHYASKGQMQTGAVKYSSYCGRYGYSEASCSKTQADKAKARAQN